jgi:ABC-2 type transport system permease protein
MNGHPLVVESGAEILKALRAPEYIIPNMILPVAFYSLFGIIIPWGGGNNAAYLLATYGVFAVMSPAIFGFGIAVATERERGWLELKRAAPVAGSTYLLAKIYTTLIFAALALVPLYVAAGFFGGVALPRGTWAELLLVHVLATLPFILIGLTIGLVMKANGAVAVANLLFLSLAVLGGLWIPIMVFPDSLQTIAAFLPSYRLAEIALYVVGAPGDREPIGHLLVLSLMTAGLLALALLAWRRQ